MASDRIGLQHQAAMRGEAEAKQRWLVDRLVTASRGFKAHPPTLHLTAFLYGERPSPIRPRFCHELFFFSLHSSCVVC